VWYIASTPPISFGAKNCTYLERLAAPTPCSGGSLSSYGKFRQEPAKQSESTSPSGADLYHFSFSRAPLFVSFYLPGTRLPVDVNTAVKPKQRGWWPAAADALVHGVFFFFPPTRSVSAAQFFPKLPLFSLRFVRTPHPPPRPSKSPP